ncbi:MAG: hypothetical protein AAGF95_18510 [Chloroflexota bacterium]
MYALKVVQALGPIDVKNVRRDSFLRWMVIIPLGLAVAIRWVFPELIARLEPLVPFAITPYYQPIVGYGLLLLTPILIGMVIGFLLLDQNDDHTLTALQITPLSLRGYMLYRLAVPSLISLFVTIIAMPIAGVNTFGLIEIIMAALAAAPLAPLFALFLATFAQNKVQGFALMKGASIFFIIPIIAYFVQTNWQLAFGIAPTYWPAMFYWSLTTGQTQAWLYFVVGIICQAVLLLVLLQRFERVAYRS